MTFKKGHPKPKNAYSFPKGNKINLGRKHTEEWKQKMSKRQRGRKLPEQWKNNIRKAKIGRKNPSYKGGKYIKGGYVLVSCRFHPRADKDGYVRQHFLVVEKYLGRFINPKEEIHHINKIRFDNRVKNLIVFKSKGYHKAFHRWHYYNPKFVVFDGRLI